MASCPVPTYTATRRWPAASHFRYLLAPYIHGLGARYVFSPTPVDDDFRHLSTSAVGVIDDTRLMSKTAR